MEQGRRLIESMKVTTDHACRQKLRSEAVSSFQKGLGVTHEMELNTISALRKLAIDVIISPYEADAQLAHLCNIGYCNSVLTEDGDILVYSAICGDPFNVFYKFDKTGSVQVINLGQIGVLGDHGDDSSSQISGTQSSEGGKYNVSKSSKKGNVKEKEKGEKAFMAGLKCFRGSKGRRMFAQCCILAGCDYSESIHSIGLIQAQKAIIRFKDCPNDERLSKVCTYLKSMNKDVPEDYLGRVLKAEMLFHYHPVYNPLTKTVESFMPHTVAEGTNRHHSNQNNRGKHDDWSGPQIRYFIAFMYNYMNI
jgi:exonuclease-1